MTRNSLDRRDLLKLAGIGAGAVVFGSRAFGKAGGEPFYFAQLSDTHWGYQGVSNPEAGKLLKLAVAELNALSVKPAFVVFTGDLVHTTPDAAVRRQRLREFKEIVAGIQVKDVRFLAGEHDAALDAGAAFNEIIGATHYTFAHGGVNFVALDNVSDPEGAVGETQRQWLAGELAKLDKAVPLVVLAHRPLFDLAADWDWTTKDGPAVLDLLMPFKQVTVFYGHIHQEHHHKTAHIAHHAARSLVFPLPAPHSVPKKMPLAFDPAQPFQGLGLRTVELAGDMAPELVEWPLK